VGEFINSMQQSPLHSDSLRSILILSSLLHHRLPTDLFSDFLTKLCTRVHVTQPSYISECVSPNDVTQLTVTSGFPPFIAMFTTSLSTVYDERIWDILYSEIKCR